MFVYRATVYSQYFVKTYYLEALYNENFWLYAYCEINHKGVLVMNVDTVIMPVGGGGLIAGIATALKSFNPSIQIIGVQSENVHGMAESFKNRTPVKVS